MSEITIKEYSNILDDEATLFQVYKAYQTVFSQEPWNEAFKCPECNTIYGLSAKGSICGKCLPQVINLVEYWPLDRVEKETRGELSCDGAKCILAKWEDLVVGFAWGYNVKITKEFSESIRTPKLYELTQEEYFYMGEVGVLTEFRSKGLGKMLATDLISNLQDRKIILRTLEGGHMHRLITSLRGTIFHHIGDGRIIMTM